MSFPIMTFSGLAFDPMNPDPDQISLVDIIAALPHVNRYNGHTIWPYSVATHSVCLYEYGLATGHDTLNDLGWALLHDAAEVYFGDFPTPVKRSVPILREIDARVRTCIVTKFGLTEEEPAWLKDADRRICLDERHVLFPAIPWPWGDLEEQEPLGIQIPTWGVDQSREAFAQRIKLTFSDAS